MRGPIRKNALFFNPLTLTLSRRERGLKPLLRKSCRVMIITIPEFRYAALRLLADQRDFQTYRWKQHHPFENSLIQDP